MREIFAVMKYSVSWLQLYQSLHVTKLIWKLYLFPVASETNDHTWGGLKQACSFPVLKDRSPNSVSLGWNEGVDKASVTLSSRGEFITCLFQFLVAVSFHWLVITSLSLLFHHCFLLFICRYHPWPFFYSDGMGRRKEWVAIPFSTLFYCDGIKGPPD